MEDVDATTLDLALKVKALRGVRDTKNVHTKLDPEAVCLALLVSLGCLSAGHELLGCLFLLSWGHAHRSFRCVGVRAARKMPFRILPERPDAKPTRISICVRYVWYGSPNKSVIGRLGRGHT